MLGEEGETLSTACSLMITLCPHFHSWGACPNSTAQLQATAAAEWKTINQALYCKYTLIQQVRLMQTGYFTVTVAVCVHFMELHPWSTKWLSCSVHSDITAASNNPPAHTDLRGYAARTLPRNVCMALWQNITSTPVSTSAPPCASVSVFVYKRLWAWHFFPVSPCHRQAAESASGLRGCSLWQAPLTSTPRSHLGAIHGHTGGQRGDRGG